MSHATLGHILAHLVLRGLVYGVIWKVLEPDFGRHFSNCLRRAGILSAFMEYPVQCSQVGPKRTVGSFALGQGAV